MDAIKKKMQAMKLEKDNAMDRADACEQQAKDANLRAERVSALDILSNLLLLHKKSSHHSAVATSIKVLYYFKSNLSLKSR